VGAQPHDEPNPVVVTIAEDTEALLALDDWLALVADDEAVTLPQSAARFLQEAREAGEV
jgi:hypothetical protein